MRYLAFAAFVVLAACHAGGDYAQSGRSDDELDRGETNGTQFDFVTNKPDGDDWQIRIRGSSLWAAYSKGEKSDDLGTANLSAKEVKKVWKLIDALDLPERKKGKQDPDEGYVTLRLRPGDEDSHDLFVSYAPRDEPGDDVEELAAYLQDLVTKYFKEKPNF
ncbi:MAG TPA: hypothetical protein VGF94_14585 [Kofleriaceae bacterium]